MLKNTLLTLLVGLLGCFPSLFAITIINQTDSVKILEIKEAYRPAPEKEGDLAEPVLLNNHSKKITIAAHSAQAIHLKAKPSVLLISLIDKTKKGNKTTTMTFVRCYEPYVFEDQQGEFFTDDWGFVIHKPITGLKISISDPDYWSKQWALDSAAQQGYGIKCLHPLLMDKVTSLEELPEDLKLHTLGEALISSRKS